MKAYRFDDIDLGLSHQFITRFTDNDVDRFISLTEDNSPLHAERDFALGVGYNNRVVHGLLTASLFSRLVGTLLPGKYALLHAIDAKFKQPVYPDMDLLVTGTVKYKNEAYQQIEIKASINHGSLMTVATATLKVGFLSG